MSVDDKQLDDLARGTSPVYDKKYWKYLMQELAIELQALRLAGSADD